MKPGIEPVGPAAADLLADLHARCVPKPWDGRTFDELLAMPGMTALVASSELPVGFILLRQVMDEAEVIMIAVDRLARRKGIARSLLAAAIRRRPGQPALQEVFLEVAKGNEAAIRLYRGAGFVEVGVRRGYYAEDDGGGTDALVMRLAPALPCREPG